MTIKKSTATLVIFLLFISLLITGWFYWFQYRPSEIKKDCYSQSTKSYLDSFAEYDSDPELTGGKVDDEKLPTTTIKHLKENLEEAYTFCLHKNGL